MTTPANPLAGVPAPQTPSFDNPGASEEVNIPALSGAPPPPPFAQTVATSADTAAQAMPPAAARQPGAWARSLVAGVQDALAGFGAGGKTPPGAGALYGLGAGAREAQSVNNEKQARQDKLNQQNIENQRAQSGEDRQNAIAKATIAHENIGTYHDQLLNSQLEYEARQQNIATGKTSIAPYLKAGAEVIQDGANSDDIQRLLAEKKISSTQQHVFPTGEDPVMGADGKQEEDASGHPLTRTTYTVIAGVPKITLDDASAKLISENTPYKFKAGQVLDGIVGGGILQQATSAQTATAAIDEARKETQLKGLDTDEKLAAISMLPDWNAALAKTGNDPTRALQYMETDPRMKQRYPGVATTVQGLYGGPDKWQDMVEKQGDLKVQQQKLRDEEALKASNFEGNPNAKTSGEFLQSLDPNSRAIVQMIGEGRAPLNNPGYLLARKPEVLEAVAKAYPDFDASKVGAYQATTKDFTSGKDADQLQAGAVALQHLQQLKKLNTDWSRVPGTTDYQAYHNLLDTVSPELARFYDNNTEKGIQSYRDTLGATFNRDAAIEQQAKAMGVRMDTFDDKWRASAPSKVYQAKMPVVYQQAVDARKSLDPDYARVSAPATSPTPPGPPAPGMKWQHSASTGQFRQVPVKLNVQ